MESLIPRMITIILFIATCYYDIADGHGAMVKPINWFDAKKWIKTNEGMKFDFHGMKSGMMCQPGCNFNPKDICPKLPNGCVTQHAGCACMWFNNYTFIEKPTLYELKYRTYPHTQHSKYIEHMPWRAPGYAKVDSPCGVGGGNINGCNGDCTLKGGYPFGIKAETFNFPHEKTVTNWTRGADVEVAWGIRANHGGGYSYRLCKLPEEGVTGLTEECFQKTPLKFVGSTQWAQYGEDESTRFEFPAVRLDVGTFPEGSQWTKNPIPACNGILGGFDAPNDKCTNGTQFPPPRPDLAGFGVHPDHSIKPFQFSIIDKVNIPKSLDPGNYVLSFRWDCEQSAQVWNTCASIYLE